MEEDLASLASCLQPSLCSVTQLSIQLQGEDNPNRHNLIIETAAAAVRILGRFCSPLTHVLVSGDVRSWGENTFTPLLDVASAVCSSSLTNFSFSMQARYPHVIMRGLGKDDVLETGCDFSLNKPGAVALSSCSRLTHLRLEHGDIYDDQGVWAALPASLQCLDMRELSTSPPEGHLLPNLVNLVLQSSDCYCLRRVMQACPNLKHLTLKQLCTPTCVEEQTDLAFIMENVAWCPSDVSGSHYPSVKRLAQAPSFLQPTYLAPWEVLAALPSMPTITNFKFDFTFEVLDEQQLFNQGRLLHHIPRAFPHIKHLRLEHVLLLDSDLTELQACTSLSRLELWDSANITEDALLLLAGSVPHLNHVKVTNCSLVSAAHIAEVNRSIKDRGLA